MFALERYQLTPSSVASGQSHFVLSTGSLEGQNEPAGGYAIHLRFAPYQRLGLQAFTGFIASAA
jgi:hypothetical protein